MQCAAHRHESALGLKTSVPPRIAEMLNHPHIEAASNLRMARCSFGFLLLASAQVAGDGFNVRIL